jgi:DNA-binding NarL/FixJ family response regulator
MNEWPHPSHGNNSIDAPMTSDWVAEAVVLSHFNISKKTLSSWCDKGLPFYRIGRLTLYKKHELNELIEKQRNVPGKAPGAGTPFTRVGIVDDHASVTRAFSLLVNSMPGMMCTLQATSGEDCLKQLEGMEALPDILLMDVVMDGMNGIETTERVTAIYAGIKIVALSNNEDDYSILKMIHAGACAYLSKYILPEKLEEAIREVYKQGKYKADLFHLYSDELRKVNDDIVNRSFTVNEKQYLQLKYEGGFTHKEIGQRMQVSESSVDYYSRCISDKLHTKSTALMVIEALRMGIISANRR